MPITSERLHMQIRSTDDRRRKLSDEDKQQICTLYNDGTGNHSQRTLAKLYGVSRRLIVFTLYPERMRRVPWKKYYTKETRREYMRTYRRHRRELYFRGQLISDKRIKKSNLVVAGRDVDKIDH